MYRCNKTEMRWNKKAVSRSSPERWLILCTKTVRKLECRPMSNVTAALPSVQRRKAWPSPLLECREVTLPRRETHWNVLGCSKLANRFQPLVGRSLPYCEDMWRRHCCLASFFPIVDTFLNCDDIARHTCAMVPRWRTFSDFWVLHLQRAGCSTFQTCILDSH